MGAVTFQKRKHLFPESGYNFREHDHLLRKHDHLLRKHDPLFRKQDRLFRKQDPLFEKQDRLLGKQDPFLGGRRFLLRVGCQRLVPFRELQHYSCHLFELQPSRWSAIISAGMLNFHATPPLLSSSGAIPARSRKPLRGRGPAGNRRSPWRCPRG